MKCWKFIIPLGEWRDFDVGVGAAGCAAIVFAETREEAATLLRASLEPESVSVSGRSWVDVATVIEVDPSRAQVALRVQS